MGHFIKKLKSYFSGLNKGFFNGARAQAELDKKLVFSLSKSRWPSLKQLKYAKRYLSQGERTLVAACFLVIILNSLFLAARFYKNHLVVRPVAGGEYVEGVIGNVKYVNPLYSSVSDADNDLVGLIFSSLFKRGENGQLKNDLAQSHSLSPDGKTYAVKIRNGASWHNGAPLTADDIVFTFEAIKNPQYKSPWRLSFTGVEIEKIDDQTLRFALAEPYAAFLDLLTFGILPQELWRQIEPAAASLAEYNIKPLGSGPYKFKSLVKDKSGNIRAYNLISNSNYYGQTPYINNLSFRFYGNITEAIAALNNNLLDGLSYLPETDKQEVVAQNSLNYYKLKMPKLSAIFFNNKSGPFLADKKVRQALAYAIDKNKIISDVMAGNARLIDSPILPDSFAYNIKARKYESNNATSTRLLNEAGWKITEIKEEDINRAQEELAAKDEAAKKMAEAKIAMGPGKWLLKNNNFLTIELTTIDIPEYSRTAGLIKEFWQAVNVKTDIKLVPANQIQAEVLKTRNFSSLFYGEIAGADPDPYAFWHSSQAGQAGLNLAEYNNKDVDKLLEEGRLTNDLKVREEKYKRFQEIFADDVPAIYLYSPYYTYVQSKNIKGFNVDSIILPNDRFANINEWYLRTGKTIVW